MRYKVGDYISIKRDNVHMAQITKIYSRAPSDRVIVIEFENIDSDSGDQLPFLNPTWFEIGSIRDEGTKIIGNKNSNLNTLKVLYGSEKSSK